MEQKIPSQVEQLAEIYLNMSENKLLPLNNDKSCDIQKFKFVPKNQDFYTSCDPTVKFNPAATTIQIVE